MATPNSSSIITIIGGKGGLGKSVFASNLACAIQTQLKAKTCLIDSDPNSCGDLNILLNLKPTKTFSDLTSFSGNVSQSVLNSHLTKHSSGLSLLASVVDPTQSPEPESSNIGFALNTIAQSHPFIIVDQGHEWSPSLEAMLHKTHLLIFVLTPDLLTLNHSKKLLNKVLASGVPKEIIYSVVNQATPNGIKASVLSSTMKLPLLGQIPEDNATVQSSIQKGMPFVLTSRSPVAAGFTSILRQLQGGLLAKLKAFENKKPANHLKVLNSSNSSHDSNNNKLKLMIHEALIKEMDLKKDLHNTKEDPKKETELREKTKKMISQLITRMAPQLAREQRSTILEEVLAEALDLGALEKLLSDDAVTEIMVNGCDRIFVEKNGKVVLSPLTFTSNQQLRNIIERIVTPLGRRIDEKTPYVDARLKDGSRVNAVIEPLSIDGPALTIRKFAKETITPQHYLNWGSMTQPMVHFLKLCVEQGLNVVISGGTGSGKTTLLNVLSSFIPSNERIVTVEDAAELQLSQEHVVRLETRPANMEGTGAIEIRDLVRNSLRMRPDRIIVGECRDGAALDMLQAMNTGHDGSMTTVHANSPREGVSRLMTLCMMAGMDLPSQAIREQIAGAVNLFVQIGRLSDGSRKVKSITEVVGMQGETITLQEVYRFKEEGFDKNRKIVGQFQATGLIPTFIEKFERKGLKIPRTLFSNDPSTQKAGVQKAGLKKTSTQKAQVKSFKPKSLTKKAVGGSDE